MQNPLELEKILLFLYMDLTEILKTKLGLEIKPFTKEQAALLVPGKWYSIPQALTRLKSLGQVFYDTTEKQLSEALKANGYAVRGSKFSIKPDPVEMFCTPKEDRLKNVPRGTSQKTLL